MSGFENFFSEIKSNIPQLAQASLKQFAGEAGGIMADYLENAKMDLQSYSLMLATGGIDKDEFASSVRAKIQVGKMRLLQIKGLAEAAVDEFLSSLEDSVISSAFKFLI